MVVTDLPRRRAEREERRDWWKSAACRETDPELFFPVSAVGLSRKDIARAKAICASCLVRRPCLEFALATNQIHGVWGGTTEEERRRGC
jgi:WhiB family redox-sensing transcriptional regulator